MNRIFSSIQPTAICISNYSARSATGCAAARLQAFLHRRSAAHDPAQDPDELRAAPRGDRAYIPRDRPLPLIFNQSMVSAMPKLGWLLGCLPVGWLNRMTQSEKPATAENAGLGLYAYPC